MKKSTKHLKLNRETVQGLTGVVGGVTTSAKATICTVCITCRPQTCYC